MQKVVNLKVFGRNKRRGMPGEWRRTQVLAIPNTDTDADTNIDSISSVKFDSSGKFLSIGDCGGRVTIFRMEINPKGNIRYKYYLISLHS